MINDFLDEFTRYKMLADKAIAQVSDEALGRVLAPGTNSIGMLVRHVSGNLRSRFTDFLTSDGEKPWRDRDAEFEERSWSRAELNARWDDAWRIALTEVGALTESDLARTVRIRGLPLSVHAALARSTAHVATHVGQIVLLARLLTEREWVSLSIPKGASKEYAANPTREKKPI